MGTASIYNVYFYCFLSLENCYRKPGGISTDISGGVGVLTACKFLWDNLCKLHCLLNGWGFDRKREEVTRFGTKIIRKGKRKIAWEGPDYTRCLEVSMICLQWRERY